MTQDHSSVVETMVKFPFEVLIVADSVSDKLITMLLRIAELENI